VLNGTENITRPWLNRPINRDEATLTNELIKAIERTDTTDMDKVMEKNREYHKSCGAPLTMHTHHQDTGAL
jgi:hypothetical protein